VASFPETSQTIAAQEDLPDSQASPKDIGEQFHVAIRRTSQSLGLILKDRNIVLILLTYLASSPSRKPSLDVQFMRQRFKWRFSSVVLLSSLSGLVKIALLLVLLPLANMALNNRNWAPIIRDIFISRTSLIVAVLGSFLIAVSFHPVVAGVGIGIMSLSSGFTPVVRSIASSLVDPKHIGTLYASVGVVTMIGITLSGPMNAGLFNLGLRLGGLWSGLPYLINSGLLVVALAAMSRIRPRMAPGLLIEEEGEGDWQDEEL